MSRAPCESQTEKCHTAIRACTGISTGNRGRANVEYSDSVMYWNNVSLTLKQMILNMTTLFPP